MKMQSNYRKAPEAEKCNRTKIRMICSACFEIEHRCMTENIVRCRVRRTNADECSSMSHHSWSKAAGIDEQMSV